VLTGIAQEPAVGISSNAIYIGTRIGSRKVVTVWTLRSHNELQPRLDLVRHCPAGFDWANGTASGEAQLALALLAHATGDDRLAQEHYEIFAHEIVSRLPKARWELTASQILQQLRFVVPAVTIPPRSKVAIIRALVPVHASDKFLEIEVQGCGRSVRRASVRALLTLLGHKQLRRRKITNLQIELSVKNTTESKTPTF
jgi:hypothetical protein